MKEGEVEAQDGWMDLQIRGGGGKGGSRADHPFR